MSWLEITFWLAWSAGFGGYAITRIRGEKDPVRWWLYAIAAGASALLGVLASFLAAAKIKGLV